MLEPADQQYVMIGHIAQAHGVDGTILMIPEHDAPALFETIDLVRLQNTRGDLVPARIESVRVQERNDRLSFFVKFDHITDRNQAEALKNHRIYADRTNVGDLTKPDGPASLISFEIRDDQDNLIGSVDDLIENPAHPILVAETKTGDLMIPFVDEYITSTDEENAIIYCKNLNQLTDNL